MALTLPFPGQPAPNSALVSNPNLQNINAITQAIQSFDASQVAAGTLTASAFATSINPNTILHDTIQPFVQSGGVWSAVSGFIGTMTGATIYVGTSLAFYRVVVNGIGSHTFTASTDTYIDIDYNGNIYYSAVSNNATSPSLTANALRVAIVVTNGSQITVINQANLALTASTIAPVVGSITLWKFDSLGNPIYPTLPVQNTKMFQQRITNSTSGQSTTNVPYNGFGGTYVFNAIAGRNYSIQLNEPSVIQSTSISPYDINLYFFIGGTQIGSVQSLWQNSGQSQSVVTIVKWHATSSGSASLTMQLSNTSGATGTWTFVGATNNPAQLTIVEEA